MPSRQLWHLADVHSENRGTFQDYNKVNITCHWSLRTPTNDPM